MQSNVFKAKTKKYHLVSLFNDLCLITIILNDNKCVN